MTSQSGSEIGAPVCQKRGLAALSLMALGIVFGDIGTSPLYTLKIVMDLAGQAAGTLAAMGLLSLIVWALIIIVCFKYVALVMRADNHGEGGILALMSLLRLHKHHRPVIITIALLGAALIYGDGAITPAISVLSAVEGLKLSAPSLSPFIVPISVGILVLLFAVQRAGSARIGWVFGPVMGLWFVVIAALGVRGLWAYPHVLAALNPMYALNYLATHGSRGFFELGGVFLAVTGAEALYADMGHVGGVPIRLAWYGLVLPALLLNYAGQTALFISGQPLDGNLFFELCPASLYLPLTGLATLATIIASQSIIAGAFSMTRQAINLGWCPRLQITQTSQNDYGQIYIGAVNWGLMIVTVVLTIIFASSDSLAAAYGIAVSLTMFLTTILLYAAMREIWEWSFFTSVSTAGVFFLVDATFFASNLLKIRDGGWIPLVFAVAIYTVMVSWRRGSVAMAKAMQSLTVPVHEFLLRLGASDISRVPGTAVFLTKTTDQVPPIIIWHVKHNRALHRQLIALAVVMTHVPYVQLDKRLTIETLGEDFWRVIGHYGFMEKADIPALLQQVKSVQPQLDLGDVVYYVGHETIRHCHSRTSLPLWQEKLYALLHRNSAQIHEYLDLPPDQVVEIGRQIEV